MSSGFFAFLMDVLSISAQIFLSVASDARLRTDLMNLSMTEAFMIVSERPTRHIEVRDNGKAVAH